MATLSNRFYRFSPHVAMPLDVFGDPSRKGDSGSTVGLTKHGNPLDLLLPLLAARGDAPGRFR